MNNKASSQRGVSLIEALVALLVLALGIMGMAGIQTRTLVESRTTNSRALALQMADDLLDRMQANSALRINPPAVSPYLAAWGALAAAPVNCFAAGCNGAQLAAFDLVQWKASLARVLPGGDARVFRSNTDATQFGILIGWTETQAKNQGEAAGAQATLFTDAVAIRDAANAVGTGVAGVACPAGLICHLVYIRP
ncbi:type IV pilus modification protein PilV [Hydrogenophaga sp. ANAO-22]|jgi:type IV pilus assembly protein PilV|uniref:type IV pilus modification protein PilV n=1 Tax=Hydrogenophaga sp. ANAO-22 TaxID=3166645 RepID=UPI0036D3FAF6